MSSGYARIARTELRTTAATVPDTTETHEADSVGATKEEQ
jgi:hypothetical protein